MRIDPLGIEIAHRNSLKYQQGDGLPALTNQVPTGFKTGVREQGMNALHDLIGLLLIDGVLDFSALELDRQNALHVDGAKRAGGIASREFRY